MPGSRLDGLGACVKKCRKCEGMSRLGWTIWVFRQGFAKDHPSRWSLRWSLLAHLKDIEEHDLWPYQDDLVLSDLISICRKSSSPCGRAAADEMLAIAMRMVVAAKATFRDP